MALVEDTSLDVLFVGHRDDLLKGFDRVMSEDKDLKRSFEPSAAGLSYDFENLIRHAETRIGMDDDPTESLKDRRSSLATCLRLVQSKEADILVTPGNSGAAVKHASYDVTHIDKHGKPGFRDAWSNRRKESFEYKPGLIARLPNFETGKTVHLCDTGAIRDPTFKSIADNAILMTVYLKIAEGLDNPRIALLNIGTEPKKGDLLHRQAYNRLKDYHSQGLINFVGNYEPIHALTRDVADGFASGTQSANVGIKFAEAVASAFKHVLLSSYYKLNSIVRVPIFGPGYARIKHLMESKTNYKNYGGAFLTGTIFDNVVIAHGSAGEQEIAGAIKYAARISGLGINEAIKYEMKRRHSFFS